ncbi:MAG TPA: M56 family metallopeptidase [Polyangiaceae bacterium]|jgi:beta-lactamase regulating signal transducer with metallopeptidase domain
MLEFIQGLAASPVATLTDWGQALSRWLLAVNAWTLALLAGALLLDRLLARRTRASWRMALYLPVALRVVLPFSWTIPVASAPRVVTFLTPRPEGFLPPEPGPFHAPLFTWQAALLVVYAAVGLVLVALRVRAQLRLRRELEGARALSSTPSGVPCPVVQHETLGPMVVGLRHPRIVVPSQLLEPDQAAALACVLGHESAHVRRGDAWLVVALQLATVAFWPVLPLWIAAQRVRALVEMACDETALDAADATARRRYGETLIDMAEWRTVALLPLGAGELHFGSTLRGRIEAIANVRRWPRLAQAILVALAVGGFAACSSVGTQPAPTGDPVAMAPAQAEAWSRPTRGLVTVKDLQQACSELLQPLSPSGDNRLLLPPRYLEPLPSGLPAEQVSFCTSAAVRDFVMAQAMATEARAALGQIGKDISAAYASSVNAGAPSLCPSGPPTPRVPQAPGTKYLATGEPYVDWNDRAGWECIRFFMDAPFYFQYTLVSDGKSFRAIAHAQRTNYLGQVVDITMVLPGKVLPNQALALPPSLEETWKVL